MGKAADQPVRCALQVGHGRDDNAQITQITAVELFISSHVQAGYPLRGKKGERGCRPLHSHGSS